MAAIRSAARSPHARGRTARAGRRRSVARRTCRQGTPAAGALTARLPSARAPNSGLRGCHAGARERPLVVELRDHQVRLRRVAAAGVLGHALPLRGHHLRPVRAVARGQPAHPEIGREAGGGHSGRRHPAQPAHAQLRGRQDDRRQHRPDPGLRARVRGAVRLTRRSRARAAKALAGAGGVGGRSGAGDPGRLRRGRREPGRRPAGGGAAITWAAYSVMLRPLFGRYSAARISALMVSIGGVMILPFGLPQMHEQDWAGLSDLHWAAWGYSTIFPVLVTNLLYFRALRTIGASRATLYMYLQPFLGALFAAWLLGEQVTGLQILGGAVIVGGVSMGRLMPGATVRE